MLMHSNNRGFSLIELMFALLIGLVITGGVFSLYSSTRDTQRSSQEQLQLVADARFALNTLAYDIRHAGSLGTASKLSAVFCRKGDTEQCPSPLPAIAGDCQNGWYTDFVKPIIGSDNLNAFASTCATVNYKGGTDVFAVKYADPAPIPVNKLSGSFIYVRSNTQAAQIFRGPMWQSLNQYKFSNTPANNAITRNHKLIARAYYVSEDTEPGDGWPSLRRAELSAGPVYTSNVLVPGVQDLQIEYGVDTANPPAGRITSYVSANNIPVVSGTATPNWTRVLGVRVWLLVRSQRPDREGITGAQTFNIANNAPVTFNDSYHRMLVSSVIHTRNNKKW